MTQKSKEDMHGKHTNVNRMVHSERQESQDLAWTNAQDYKHTRSTRTEWKQLRSWQAYDTSAITTGKGKWNGTQIARVQLIRMPNSNGMAPTDGIHNETKTYGNISYRR